MMGGAGVLAIDLGGTKTLVALVEGSAVVGEATVPTERGDGPDRWLQAVFDAAAPWRGRFSGVGLAVTGFVRDGCWSAMNPATLGIPSNYPLLHQVEALFSLPAMAVNDAQAAAWGEHVLGAGEGEDLVFLTISTGVGGGIVSNGRLLGGLAGHFGLLAGEEDDTFLEERVSGRWMAAEAARRGHAADAREVFAQASSGEAWAREIVSASAGRVARLCRNIQLALDPPRIVLGGGIGLADGFIDAVSALMPPLGAVPPVALCRARLGVRAGILGVGDLARAAFSAPAR
ncbi:ROK family protein [Consotaella salsifontis]|uniref:N-acylmannosamine kinase/N-acetylmannosamine-6-phosphate 2-epimerase / N-acetylmannosamine kinase n=1 Tax=Consotaella salsifontis TaxID=1365950 RepID=A0A1T4S7Q3_9HYPH|nr:ROK family protein [Consotaella salsifontis]SKA24273.1 N-acylmannosamine kinase/N-acetylmannosamine-6-phosphate 2-epimerase / N-acetylmannosamine kinase [Consotaella salsifontis]